MIVDEDALEEFIDTIVFDIADDDGYYSGGVYTHGDKDDDSDYTRDGIHEDLDDKLERYCEMNDDEKLRLYTHHPKLEQFKDGLEEYCNTSDDGVKITIEDYLEELASADRSGFSIEDYIEEYHSESKYTHSNKGHGNLKDHLAMYCEMTDDEKAEKMKMHHDLPDDLKDRLVNYCDLSEDEQDEFRDSMMDRMDEFKDHAKYKKMSKSHMMDFHGCDSVKSNPSTGVQSSEMLSEISDWCAMTPEQRNQYYHDMCDSDESGSVTGSGNSQVIDGVSDWCNMMSEKRAKHASGTHDSLNEKSHDKMKMSDVSPSLKAMIMDKHGISDERRDELKMKYIEKHGDLTDKKQSELIVKFKDHIKTMKHKISDERKSDIHDRLAEMKAFKAELHEKSSEMTDEEKQQFREAFIEKAKDMQLAWILPHIQMTAGALMPQKYSVVKDLVL